MHRHNPSPHDVLCFSTEGKSRGADYGIPELIARAQKFRFEVRLVSAGVVGFCEVKILTPKAVPPSVRVIGVEDPERAAGIAALHSLLFVSGWDLGDADTRKWFEMYLAAMAAIRDGDMERYVAFVSAMDDIRLEDYSPALGGDSW